MAVQRELEAAIRGFRSLPKNNVGLVHNFQDIVTADLNGYLPGSSYLRRRADRDLLPLDQPIDKLLQSKLVFFSRILSDDKNNPNF